MFDFRDDRPYKVMFCCAAMVLLSIGVSIGLAIGSARGPAASGSGSGSSESLPKEGDPTLRPNRFQEDDPSVERTPGPAKTSSR